MRYREISESAEGYDLKAKYDEFNRKWFEGQLPEIPVSWENRKGRGGAVLYQQGTQWPHKVRTESLQLVLSSRFKRSEEALDKILLHEMIHVYFLSRGIAEGHGPRFSAMRRRLSELTGIDIPVTDDVEDLELVDTRVKTYGVFTIHRKDGLDMFALLYPKAAHEDPQGSKAIWQQHLAKRPNYETAELYTISTPVWTLAAAKTRLQRSFVGKTVNFSPFEDGELADLKKNGHLIWRISKE